MKEIKCPYDLNQFILGEPIFENTFPEKECEQRKFYGDCYHCFSTAIAKCFKGRDREMISDDEKWRNIEILSELRSDYSCFEENEEPYYRALSVGIKAIREQITHETILDKIRFEIDKIYEREGSSFDCLKILDELKEFIDKCKAEVVSQKSGDKDTCNKCLHVEETDGSNCYECVKGKSKFEARESEDNKGE